ncbi:MAG TPA: hypothetical protein VGL97_12550 [Bryobacteraceae bacterium]|jgi:hypothetical protein
MSAAPQMAGQTKIFGVRVGVDPRILVGGMIGLAAVLFWYNMHGSDDDHGPTAAARPAYTAPAAAANHATILRRLNNAANERGELRVRPVDASRGDIDPTLRLGLLERLKAVKLIPGSRNLFEAGAVAAANLPAMPKVAPIIPRALPPVPVGPANAMMLPAVNIPFKYYGFVKPGTKGDSDRGFFMEGDNILVATEGDVLDRRYLIVTLSPTKARVEDTQVKQGQDLPVTPEANPQ